LEYAKRYFEEVQDIAKSIDLLMIEEMVQVILNVKEQKGRMFFIGVGGSAANCTHAVNDFRKIGGIECYSPSDNVAELTARTNDEGWDTVYGPWLECSHISNKDTLFVLSVGGGSKENNVSVNLIHAIDVAKKAGAKVLGIIGRDGGYTRTIADACVIIPTQSPDTITAHAEAWQAVVWHMLVTDPRIMAMSNKWESIDED
jgi:D-sedoheptulose 7-phosphate isomerase